MCVLLLCATPFFLVLPATYAVAFCLQIKFGQLASLLGINTAQAEELASKMIEQGRMKAVIDQVCKFSCFPSA